MYNYAPKMKKVCKKYTLFQVKEKFSMLDAKASINH